MLDICSIQILLAMYLQLGETGFSVMAIGGGPNGQAPIYLAIITFPERKSKCIPVPDSGISFELIQG